MSAQKFEFEKIKTATRADRDEILQFLRKYFYKDEPLNNYLKVVTEENPINHDLEDYSVACLDDGISLMGYHDGKLIAVCLNAILQRGKKETFHCKDEKFSKIVNLLDYVAEKSDPFQKFPGCDKSVVVAIISVDDSYRGRGIAKILIDKTSDLGKQNGCGFISLDCTSHFSGCAAKRLGFDLIYSLDYADYKVDGKAPLIPEPPHKAVTVYAKKID